MLLKAKSRAFLCSISLPPFALTAGLVPLPGAEPDGPDARPGTVTARAAHSLVLESVVDEPAAEGGTLRTTTTVVLATGLHRRDPATGAFLESVAKFEAAPDGSVVARRAAHEVVLAPNYASNTLTNQAGPWRSAVFSSKDDNTIGQPIPYSTGNPTGSFHGSPMLLLDCNTVALSNVCFRHAQTAVRVQDSPEPTVTLRHVQMTRCQNGVVAEGSASNALVNLYAGNCLMANVGTAFGGRCYSGTAEHLTADSVAILFGTEPGEPAAATVRNSVLASVATLAQSGLSLACTDNGFWSTTPSGSPAFAASTTPFQTVGAGAHYLAPGGPFFNKGTTNVDASLLAQLPTLTTFAPVTLTAAITGDRLIGRRVQRDADGLPDLGYHYDPLDLLVSGVLVSNGTLTLTNWVAVGVYGTAGFKLGADGRLVCGGDPLGLNRIVQAVTVQEAPPLSWVAGLNDTLLSDDSSATAASEIRMRFTEMTVPGGRGRHFSSGSRLGRLTLTDCQFTGGSIQFSATYSYPHVLAWTNNVFARLYVTVDGGFGAVIAYARNNLFWRCGALEINEADGNTWEWRDNLFDTTNIYQDYGDIPANSNNGYVNCPYPIQPPGSGNQTLSSLAYETGTLGRWYQPTNSVLIDAGSRSAAQAGLYHYTVKAANGKEGSDPSPATVDIGFHYVACTDGKPVDGDSDGLPDYFEDYDGDNGADAGETNPSLPDTDGDGLSDLLNLELGNNVLVNDPAQDYGNEQNTQWQPKVVAFGDTVVVAFWDSNRGIYALGATNGFGLTNAIDIQMAAYAVSVDGGRTFVDMDVPPKLESEYGDAGDPVLALDRASGTVYFAATSERSFYRGIPLWQSIDSGTTFARCPTIRTDLLSTDYPWIAVDDWPRDGVVLHDLYAVIMRGRSGGNYGEYDWLTVARDANTASTNWSNPVPLCPTGGGNTPSIVVASNGVAYVAWQQVEATTNSLRVRSIASRGATLGEPVTLCGLADVGQAILHLFRTNDTTGEDWFKAFRGPALAVHPFKDPAHLYVAFADKGEAAEDRADIYLTYSTDGGSNWTSRCCVNQTESGNGTTNDQWSPVIAVKPEGAKLFIGWYDRQRDPNNSMIDVYGRWGSIASNGAVSLGTQFRITTESFPPAFAGTLEENRTQGHYDPVWPPGDVELSWRYEWWEIDLLFGPYTTANAYAPQASEHSGAFATSDDVYFVWSDHRSPSQATSHPARRQADVRLARLPWPSP